MTSPTASQRLCLLAMLTPGLICCAVALLIDVLRGGRLVADWGTGQSGILCAGIGLLLAALVVDRKARSDQHEGRRRYARTVIFMLVPLLLLVVGPVGFAELVARWMPESRQTPSSFRHPDRELGFTLMPGRNSELSRDQSSEKF